MTRAGGLRQCRGLGAQVAAAAPPLEPAEPAVAPDGELVLAEKGGVGVVYIAAPTMQDLVDTNGG